MKRKVLGLTMLVNREFDYTEYTFINPVTLNVLNQIVCELASKFAMVQNETSDTEYGNTTIHTGSIICRNEQQEKRYFRNKYGLHT